ncbi:IS110 family transposase (plasmid) [Jeotgalibaca sp. MA1X17-3]|uniref:IS110 family transposase n=1 Tax=Jeotgalibaca sp. MA1X17-3 TaxID=2908211 RepID=UPI001F3BC812|nr:IS110 family transposase [Jeotgalibaca sp. MA1X17-3]UJF16757.1 IS110 family transposase [Jeotgalibaca sp. MA1X17-3]
MRVMTLDVSKGKRYVVIYEEEVCVAEFEIKHNQEGFNQLKSQLCKETTKVVFEATGVYFRQI